MVSTITFNPILTTNAAGSFNRQTTGYIQGIALDDPATRNALKGGYLLASEALPMWGGVGITTGIPGATGTPNSSLGQAIGRATALGPATSGQQALGLLTGFSVFNQDHSMINSPQSPVPLAAALMGLTWYQLGSNARIAVAIDPVLADLESFLTKSLVSWDFGAQRLIPYVAAYPAVAFTSLSWSGNVASGTTASPHGLAPGEDFVIAGVVPTGYNGSFTAIAGTTGSTVKFALTPNPGAVTTLGGILAGGGALPCAVLDVQIGNSMTVDYDPDTGFATWNREGSTAIIQI